MSTSSNALEIARDVDRLLTNYIAAHDACFLFSLRQVIPIPGIFRPIDFRRVQMDLYGVYIQLQEAKVRIDLALSGPSLVAEWRRFLEALSAYTVAVMTTVGWLASICSHLGDKSQGASYRANQYTEDLSGYQASVDRYLALGSPINQLLKEAIDTGSD